MKANVRTSWQVTRSVWYALFMREALARTTADRMAWFWMILEPIAHIVLLSALRSVSGVFHTIAGAPVVPWLVVGLMSFFLFRDGVTRSLGAVDSNKALFTYRQVSAVDTVLVRVFVEGLLKTIIFILMIMGLLLLGFNMVPSDPLGVTLIWLTIWFFGIGSGLICSVVSELIPEIGKIIRITMFPLYLISGVLFPLNFLPEKFHSLILINPIVHSIELMRTFFFDSYWTLSGISLSYLIIATLFQLTLGLALHLRFKEKLKSL